MLPNNFNPIIVASQLSYILICVLRQALSKLPRMDLKSPCSPDRYQTWYPPASAFLVPEL